MNRTVSLFLALVVILAMCSFAKADDGDCTVTFRSVNMITDEPVNMLNFGTEKGAEEISISVNPGYKLHERDIPEVKPYEPGTLIKFDHWSIDPSGYEITEDIEFIAYCMPRYTIVFQSSQAGVFDRQIVEHGHDAIAPQLPNDDRERFLVWDTDYTNVTKSMNITSVYCKLGDCNIDGEINTGDAVQVLKASAGIEKMRSDLLIVADVNRDNTLNTGDAVLILKYAAGMITSF